MSKPTFLLVDGHSVIFAISELRRSHSENPRHGREELVSRLSRYVDASAERVVVVFDGQGRTAEEPCDVPGLRVIYSGGDKTADAIIERLVVRYADIYELTVVTEDLLERTTVEAAGGWTMGVVGLVDRMERAEVGLREKIERLRGGRG